MVSFYSHIFILFIAINFSVANILERLPCGRLFVEDALKNCGSSIAFPLCEEVASQCCGSSARCPLTQVLKCCNNGS